MTSTPPSPSSSAASASPDAAAASRGLVRKVMAMVIVAVLLYGGYTVYVGAEKIAAALAHFQWWAFFAACALAFGNYMLRFLKWEFYLARLEIRGIAKLESLLVFLSGFVLTVTPGKVGEVFKSALLSERHAIPIARTAPIVVADRVTDVIGIAVLIAVGSAGFAGGMVWALAGMGLVTTLLIVVGSRTLSLGIVRVVERGPGPCKRIAPKLAEAYESLAILVSPKNLVLPTLISIVAWLCECLALWVILQGFGQGTAIPLCLFFYATSTLAGAIVPTPGGLGVTETLLQQGLTQLGKVADTFATASMILVRFATLWFAVLVGFIALSLLRARPLPSALATRAVEGAALPEA